MLRFPLWDSQAEFCYYGWTGLFSIFSKTKRFKRCQVKDKLSSIDWLGTVMYEYP